MKRQYANVGPVVGSGFTKTDAKERALSAAARLLNQLDRARPQLVVWNGDACLVYCTFTTEGEVVWFYTNPRPIAELSMDMGRERMGTAGCYSNESEARSFAMNHLIQNDPRGIPEELPDDLSPKDRELLVDLRRLRAERAAA